MLSRRNEWVCWVGVLAVCLGGVGCACKRGPAIRGQNPGPGWPPPPAPIAPLPTPPPAATLNAPIAAAPRQQPTPAVPVAAPRPVPAQPAVQPAAPSVESGIPAAPPIPSQAPATPAPAADPNARLQELYRLAATSYAQVDGYTAQLRRREVINGEDKPEELVLFKFRKQPWSAYFKWIGPEANGREVIYVKGRYDNKIHSHLGPKEPAIPFMGRKMAVAPDNILVRSRSRHDIGEAGVGFVIEQFGRQLSSPQARLLRYAGPMQVPEYAEPLDTVEQTIPPGAEPQLPRGGRRLIGYDPASHFPVLVVTHDDRNRQVEYYLYDQLQYPVTLSDSDFNPERLGVASR